MQRINKERIINSKVISSQTPTSTPSILPGRPSSISGVGRDDTIDSYEPHDFLGAMNPAIRNAILKVKRNAECPAKGNRILEIADNTYLRLTGAAVLATSLLSNLGMMASQLELAKMENGIPNHKNSEQLKYLGISVVYFISSQIAASVSDILTQKLSQSSYKRFLFKVIDRKTGRIDLWSSSDDKRNQSISALASHGRNSIADFVFFGKFIWDGFCAITVNAWLAAKISNIFSIPVLLSGLGLSIWRWRNGREITQEFHDEKNKQELAIDAKLQSGSDNVFFHNPVLSEPWIVSISNLFSAYEESQARGRRHELRIKFEILASNIIPFFVFLGWYYRDQKSNLNSLAILGIPSILRFSTQIGCFIPGLLGLVRSADQLKLSVLQAFPAYDSAWEKRVIKVVDSNKCTVARPLRSAVHSIQNVQDLISMAYNGRLADVRGRLQLCGDNGAGKSTLMELIYIILGEDKCFYYGPKMTRLGIENNDSCSQGEKQKRLLLSILTGPKANVLLLDEWDTALDRNTIKDINKIIDRVSENKFVLETSHRTNYLSPVQ